MDDNFGNKALQGGGKFGIIQESECKTNGKLDYLFYKECMTVSEVYDGCLVAKVRCSGFPGSKSNKAGIRKIGRLYPPLTINTSLVCTTTLTDIIGKNSGDPGSKYTFRCPDECGASGSTQGVGI